jgi:magnesium-transporting ATPase (P-type)
LYIRVAPEVGFTGRRRSKRLGANRIATISEPCVTAAPAKAAASADHDGGDGTVAWWVLVAQDVADRLAVDPTVGLAEDEVKRQLDRYCPNELAKEPPPSAWEIARGQLSNPMNIVLILAAIASFAIDQIATTGVIVAVLVAFNVVEAGRPSPPTTIYLFI